MEQMTFYTRLGVYTAAQVHVTLQLTCWTNDVKTKSNHPPTTETAEFDDLQEKDATML